MTRREQNIIMALMRTLEDAGGEPFSTAVIHAWMDRYIQSPRITKHELDAAIARVQESGWIRGTAENAMGNDTVWVITAKGRLRE